jgi:TRAP-type mannitol/chloroaromatic compound transport system permease large subunit
MELLLDYLGIVMLLGLIVLLLTGYPVAFAISGTAILFGVLGLWLDFFDLRYLGLITARIFGIMSNAILLALPFFIFMGLTLEKSKLAENLLETIGMLFGRVRGGLALAMVLVGTLLAATTGVVAATVIAMGLIALPIMLRYGYQKTVATGSIAAAGTLGQIIPPSIVLIVLGDQLGVSVGDLFLGAAIPGLMLSALFLVFIAGYALLNPKVAPALPKQVIADFATDVRGWKSPTPLMVGYLVAAATLTLYVFTRLGWGAALDVALLAALVGVIVAGGMWTLPRNLSLGFTTVAIAITVLVGALQGFGAAILAGLMLLLIGLGVGSVLWRRALKVMVPPLFLVVVVLGSIFFGVATPTEAGALGAVGAILLAVLNRQMSWQTLRDVSLETAKFTSMVAFILIGATAFGLVFRGLGGDRIITDVLVGLPGGVTGFIIFTMLLIFILGFFIEFFEIAFIVVPILLPAAQVLGIDLLWFGILVSMNIQTSFLTPPLGYALFYLRGVAPPEVKTTDIYRGVAPFIVVQVIALAMVVLFPQLVTWLPAIRPGP